MKKKKLIIALVSVVLVIAIAAGGICFLSFKSPNYAINRCYDYSKEYLEIDDNLECFASLPTDKATQDEIEKYASEIIELGSYEGYMYTTKYLFSYIGDCRENKFFYGNTIGVESLYYYEVVILKLKVLLVQGRADEFEELFSEYSYALSSHPSLINYIDFFVNDTNYPVEYNDEKYIIMENAYLNTIEEYDGVKEYFALIALRDFYACFEETEELSTECESVMEEMRETLGSAIRDDAISRHFREYFHF